MNNVEQYIKEIVDWQPLTKVYGRQSSRLLEFVEKHGSHGVYQIALKEDCPEPIIHSDIGYVGKSTNIMQRVYDIKTNRHGCRTYLNSKNIPIEEVRVRFLMTEPGNETALENEIHRLNEDNYGYRFKWREASGGNDGSVLRVIESIDKIENLEDLKQIAIHIDARAQDLFLQNWKNED
jgi:hypothetical protein